MLRRATLYSVIFGYLGNMSKIQKTKGMKFEGSMDINYFKESGCEIQKLNSGNQIVIRYHKETADYWPQSDRFYIRTRKQKGVGLTALAQMLGIPIPGKPGGLTDDRCFGCNGPSEIGGHGIRNGSIYSEYYCIKCYSARHKIPEKAQTRLAVTD